MKKLLSLAVAAALFVPAFAEEEEEDVVEAVNTALEDNDAPAHPVVREAIWPAFFAFCDWPATPDLVGLRVTIPFSSRQESVTGIDIGLWGSSFDYEGIQLNVLRNKVRDSFGGFQIGLYNSASRADIFSLQVGLWNEANSFCGLQCGLINLSGDGYGLQVGLINRVETLYGFQVGLLNIIRDSEVPFFPCLNIGF